MTIYIVVTEKGVQATSDMYLPDRSSHATIRRTIQPGGNFYGITYEQLLALGNGKHEVELPDVQPGIPTSPGGRAVTAVQQAHFLNSVNSFLPPGRRHRATAHKALVA